MRQECFISLSWEKLVICAEGDEGALERMVKIPFALVVKKLHKSLSINFLLRIILLSGL